jgi:hypothetical protein
MRIDLHNFSRKWVIAAIIFPLAFALSACEQNTASFAAQRRAHAVDETVASNQTAELIRQLQVAKELDQSDAYDPDLTPIRREDFTIKAGKADRAIRELQHGFAVSSAEVEDALEIPPRHLTPGKRVELIQQLQQAKALDEHRAQEILIYWRDDEPIQRNEFDAQAERAAAVAKDLQLGESVHWADIKAALYVPPDPL